MPDEQIEAKDFDQVADMHLAELEKETPADSSTEIKPKGDTETAETTETEAAKSEKVKEVEGDGTLSPEDKIAKIKEILGDDEKAIDAYIKSKGYHNDPAWQKQRELIDKLKKESGGKSVLSDEDKAALAEFKQWRSTPDYIQQTMKAHGYTQEAIDKKLGESGFDVHQKSQDDVQLVLNKLGIKLDDMAPTQAASLKENVEDVVKIADIIIQDRLGKILPKELEPVRTHLTNIEKSENSSKIINMMKETTKSEGVLDFEKDIEPALNKFLNENPDALQDDVLEHFKSISRSMTIERLRTGKRKDERDEKKGNLRQNISTVRTPAGVPKKTGNFDADADAFLESLNYSE